MSSQPAFPRNYWEADKIANLALIQFFDGGEWKSIQLAAPPGEQETRLEIAEMMKLKPLRDARRAEITAQAGSVDPYYFTRMMMNEKSHPRTFELMNIAVVIGRALVMHHKLHFARVRPVQLEPDLEPIVATPGHPAYPAGHPFQSMLMSMALSELRPDARAVLTQLAERIGENREIAGVHYRSDTLAGLELAKLAYGPMARTAVFLDVMSSARAEWT